MARKSVRQVKDNFDGPWKVYFRECLEDFLRFVDVEAYEEIDWSRKPEFLDKELHLISRKIKKSYVVVDSLVKVWLKTGEEKYVLIHVEFQSEKEIGFPKRIYIYNTRAYERYGVPVASYAILADEATDWNPTSFSYGFGRSRTGIDYCTLKLTDYRGREGELETSDNPFALATLAHLKTVETRGNERARFDSKIRLKRSLFKKGWNRDRIEALYYFIDWMMRLPQGLADRFEETVIEEFQEDTMLELISPREKKNLQRERREGGKEGAISEAQISLITNLTTRFNFISETLESRIRRIEEIERLRELLKKSITIESLNAFESFMNLETVS